jgi:hypothetical protein
MHRSLPALALLMACGQSSGLPLVAPEAGEAAPAEDATEDFDGGTPESASERVSPVQWVARASLDLRGVRPTLAELATVTDDDSAAVLIDSFFDDPRFGHRMAWLYNDVLHTAVWFDNSPFRAFERMTTETGRAAGFAPLALVEDIALHDRPWTDLVTATEIPHNDRVADFFGVPGTGTGDTWVAAPAWDDRPMAGILSSSTLWLAYDGDRTNFNRRRANEVSRIFLCADFLARDVAFEIRLSPEALSELERAVQTEPACGTCHSVLDPLAAYFGGFVERSANEPIEQLAQYSAWSADWYRGWVQPAYFGRPGNDITDLGAYLAADPRFTRCAARQFAEGLTARTDLDAHTLEGFHEAFAAGDFTLRALVREVVWSDEYRSPTRRVLTTEQLATAVADLVGWPGAAEEDLSVLTWEAEYRLLGGGTDDAEILVRSPDPNVGHVVLQTWLARRVVPETIRAEQGRSAEERLLFTEVDPEDRALEPADLRAQLAALHTRMLTDPVDPDSAEVDALLALFEAGGGLTDPRSGWTVVLHALLRHPNGVLF